MTNRMAGLLMAGLFGIGILVGSAGTIVVGAAAAPRVAEYSGFGHMGGYGMSGMMGPGMMGPGMMGGWQVTPGPSGSPSTTFDCPYHAALDT